MWPEKLSRVSATCRFWLRNCWSSSLIHLRESVGIIPSVCVDDSLFKELGSHPRCLIIAIPKTILSRLLLFEATRLLWLSNVENRPLLAAVLVTDESDGDLEAIGFFPRDLAWCKSLIRRSTINWMSTFLDSNLLRQLTVQIVLLHQHSDGFLVEISRVFLLPSNALLPLLQDWPRQLPHVVESLWGCIWSKYYVTLHSRIF